MNRLLHCFTSIKLKHPLLLLVLLSLSGCTSVPYTDRTQFILTSESTEIEMGEEGFKEVKDKGKISHNEKMNSAVKRVGSNIAKVTGKDSYKWEFIVLDSKDTNAFCLPGGKVVVYTGLFNYMHNDGELATVLGHEIGHAVARHAGERISHSYAESAGGYILSAVLSIVGAPPGIGSVYSVITGLGINLPYSRTQEYEADHIGIIIMAKAGYTPKTAITFWKEFSKEQNYGPVREFFATHPMGEKRLEELKKLLPQADKIYSDLPVKLGNGEKL